MSNFSALVFVGRGTETQLQQLFKRGKIDIGNFLALQGLSKQSLLFFFA